MELTMRVFKFLAVLLFGYGTLVATASARVEIDITRGVSEPMPVAIPDYLSTGSTSEPLSRNLTQIVISNLERSGLFAPIDQRAYVQNLESIHERPRFADWRLINAQVLVAGEVIPLDDGRIQVNTRLWDIYGSEQLASIAFKTPADNWRRAAHKVSDFVYKTITGEDGYFDTRVVYIAESGPKVDRTKRLMIMDQDGANPVPLTDGLDYDVLTPRFSPTQQQITYLALFDDRPAQVYLFNIATGEQEEIGSFRGMTFAPRFTPDGQNVLMSVERNGNSDIAIMDLRTRQQRLLTTNPAIDTSPSMSPAGRQITFASDRGGSEQIYVMNSDGTNQRRITFGDGRYGTPVWSPRGDLIAFTRQYRGRFYIGVIRPDGSGERLLTESYLDEGPTWSPNGRVIMFFRETRPGGPVSLWSIDLTGQNLRKVPTPGDASDPAWSPMLP
ncbi:MAG: Tol-Pal system beta propeller repeat protein TolB [Aquisalinus sp.]|nr:Tol-Pal system beta propeller repeat protein TolB [Aquisalinus sp.]